MGKHAEWRKQVKKLRRKRIRTMLAVARDQILLEDQKRRESSPTYKAWLEEQAILEEFNAAEEKRLAMQRQQIWEAENEAALLRWREQQSRLAHAKAEKFKREMLIKEEWERDQRKLQEAEEIRKKAEDEKKRKQAELLAQIDAFIEGKAEFPEEINVSTETQPGQPECPFFAKTGACRFRDSCSRNHIRPGISRTLLIPNFYDHFGLQTLNHDEYDTDLGLEYEDSETYQHFKDFYKDVVPEFEEYGTITQFRVCNNEEPHLRGNVYVEFLSRRHALKAYRTFQGRFYAGRRLNVEFSNIPSWKNAVCGLFHRKKCPKGKTCNFLHVFRNPNNAYKIQDGNSSSRRQFSRSRSRSPRRHRSRSKEWSWSEGSDSDNGVRRRSRSNSRSKGRSKKYDTGLENGKRKSRSRSPAKRRRSKSRSPNRGNLSRHYDISRDKQKKRHKDKKRSGKQRSKSRSPHRDKKRHDSKDESKKRNRKEKSDTTKNAKEMNGKEGSSASGKIAKEERKDSKKEKHEIEELSRNRKKEQSDKSEINDINKKTADYSRALSREVIIENLKNKTIIVNSNNS